MSDLSKVMRHWVERPLSVATDAAISVGIAVVLWLVLGLVFSNDGIWGGVRAGLAGVVGAAVYMRARTNLIDPAPAFK